jgi:hypothetical protein
VLAAQEHTGNGTAVRQEAATAPRP